VSTNAKAKADKKYRASAVLSLMAGGEEQERGQRKELRRRRDRRGLAGRGNKKVPATTHR
jgi:hypothetical protein